MRPSDLNLLRTPTDPRLQPGGDLVAYVVADLDTDEDRAGAALHVHDLAAGTGRRFTSGRNDRAPRWSPDGARLAFLRSPGDGEPPQVAVLDPSGGEATVLTDFELGVQDVAWTEDGERLVVTATQWRGDRGELDDEERARQPRRITELGYRHDLHGWLHDRVTRAWVVDLDGEAEALTPADHSVGAVAVDGDVAVFTSARHEERETDPGAPVWTVPLDGGEVEQLLPSGWWEVVAPSQQGRALLVGLDDPFAWPAPPRLYRVEHDGELTDLTPDLDRDVVGRPVELADGTVLVAIEDRGSVHVVAVAPDGDTEVRIGGDRTVTGVDGDGDRLVFTATHPTDPGELWVAGPGGGDPEVVTDHNAQLRERLLPVEHIVFERDGAEVDAWLVLPDADAGDAVPLLVNIHGGPTAQYGHAFFDEFQVEAGAGYAVIGCNPRGSSGRGAAWSTAVVGTWTEEGSVDILDLEAVADAALEHSDRIDADRIGVMGGSYGGYATARMLARSERYRSAVVERGLLAWTSFGGTSDIGPFFDRMFLDLSLPADHAEQWLASPVRTADRITTPTLVVHSLEDHRCPPEQALQFFTMLRRHGVTSELLLFPDEGHELSRSGSPKHRIERFAAILDWHDRFLRAD